MESKFGLPVTDQDEDDKKKTKSSKRNTGSSQCRLLDLASASDEAQLRDWCCFHFEATIKKSLDGNNQILWHQCHITQTIDV